MYAFRDIIIQMTIHQQSTQKYKPSAVNNVRDMHWNLFGRNRVFFSRSLVLSLSYTVQFNFRDENDFNEELEP